MSTQIARTGKTIAVEIPEDLLLRASLSVGDSIDWTITATGELASHGSPEHETPGCSAAYEGWKAKVSSGCAVGAA